MRIYILPSGKEALGDAMFADDREGNPRQLGFWKTFRDACRRRGIEVHTFDLWLPDERAEDDILLVHVHPEAPFLRRAIQWIRSWYRRERSCASERRRFLLENAEHFKRRILFHAEPPVVTPGVYRNLAKLNELYEKIFLTCRGFGHGSEYFNYYADGAGDITTPYFDEPKEKFMVFMNANNFPHSFRRELFGERLRAIRYWSAVPGFDLYGHRWDKMPRHPLFWHYKKYVRRSFRGTAGGKMPVISKYKFMICYENCVYDGYVSEKIFDCMAAGVIPVYLGAPDISSLVPESCFIDRRKFQSDEELHHFLLSLTADDLARYRSAMRKFLGERPDGMGRFLGRLL